MKPILFAVILLFPASAFAVTATFSWLPNSEPNLAGYKIHCGTEPITYTMHVDVGKPALTNGRVYGAMPGLSYSTTYWCAATAYDSDGNESDFSNEVTVALPDVRMAVPGGFRYEGVK